MSILSAATSDPAFDWLTKAGSVGILATGILAFMRGWIVPGSQLRQAQEDFAERYQQVREERDRAMDQNAKLNEVAQRTLEAALRKVEQQ